MVGYAFYVKEETLEYVVQIQDDGDYVGEISISPVYSNDLSDALRYVFAGALIELGGFIDELSEAEER